MLFEIGETIKINCKITQSKKEIEKIP